MSRYEPPNPVPPTGPHLCCRCCGTLDPDYGANVYTVGTCPTRDRHPHPCIMCGQRSRDVTE